MHRLIAIAALGFSASAALAADEYKIKMNRPFKVGETMMVSTRVKFSGVQKLEFAGQAPQEEKKAFEAVISGTETVDAVNAKGDISKLTIKIDKCTKDGADLVAGGATLTAENVDGKTQFKVDGNDPADEAKEVLPELIDTSKPDGPSGDEIMGTDKPQKVGDTWPVNSDVLAKEFSEGPISLTGDQVKGETKLVEVTTVDGKPSETIRSTVNVDVPKKDPNNGANVHDVKIKIDGTETMPIDDASHVATTKITRSFSFKMDSPGPMITISIDEDKEEKYSETKK